VNGWHGGTWLVCGKYELEVGLDQAGPTDGHRPFHEFPFQFLGHHALCKEAILDRVGAAETFLELFGGLGLTAAMIRARNPRWHLIVESNPALVMHLRANGFWAEHGNAFERIVELTQPVDLVDADFGRFTVLHWDREEHVRNFVLRLFDLNHRYVMFTDEAKARLGVNRSKYAAVLGTDVRDLEDYVNGWSHCWYSLYGYSIVAAEYNSSAVYTLWEQRQPVGVIPNKTLAGYRGVVPVL
jgi:hypothetical protein